MQGTLAYKKTPQSTVTRLQTPRPDYDYIEHSSSTPLTLGGNTKLPDIEEIPDGNIILIRFIRSDCMLDVFGEKFKVSKDLIYSYVKAIIVTEIRTLQVYLGDEFVCSFDYSIQP